MQEKLTREIITFSSEMYKYHGKLIFYKFVVLSLTLNKRLRYYLHNLLFMYRSIVLPWGKSCEMGFRDDIIQYYVSQSRWISRKSGVLIMRYSQKRECISFVLYCFENLSSTITLEPLVRFRWGFQQNVTFLRRTPIKQKCHMCNFRLIPLDRIKYVHVC